MLWFKPHKIPDDLQFVLYMVYTHAKSVQAYCSLYAAMQAYCYQTHQTNINSFSCAHSIDFTVILVVPEFSSITYCYFTANEKVVCE